jgi:hypothetical protein
VETAAETSSKTPPPYFAFRTLTNTLDLMKDKGVPNRVDRTFLVGMSGAGQTQFIAGLKALGLIDANGKVQPRLIEMAQAGPSERKRILGEIIKETYPEAVELGKTNATTGELVEVFKDYGLTGDTARKAIAFYLNAARYAGEIPLSPMFQTPKVSSTAGSTKKRRKVTGSSKTVVEEDQERNGEVDSGIPAFHKIVAGVLSEFPTYPHGWTKGRRDEVMKMFEMAVDFTIPIRSEEEIEEEIEEAEEEAGDLQE